MKNDPFAYLSRCGVTKGVTKSMEAGHAVPERGSPPMSTPEKKTKLATSSTMMRVAREKAFTQPDPAMTAARKSPKSANLEGNESAKYEKLEKKSMKGLKGGGTAKEMRAGHNHRTGKGKY